MLKAIINKHESHTQNPQSYHKPASLSKLTKAGFLRRDWAPSHSEHGPVSVSIVSNVPDYGDTFTALCNKKPNKRIFKRLICQ